jgi:hypothetical protein
MAVGRPGALSAAAARPWRQLQPLRRCGAAAAAGWGRRASPARPCAAPEHPPAFIPAEAEDEGEESLPAPPLAPPTPLEPARVNGHWSAGKGGLLGAFAADAPLLEAAPARPPPEPGGTVVPDLELPPPPGGAKICVFGCVHAGVLLQAGPCPACSALAYVVRGMRGAGMRIALG